MPKLLYTWYFEKFTASVTSSGHSALRHEVSRMCTILCMSHWIPREISHRILDWRQCGNSLALCYFAVVMEFHVDELQI